MLSEQGVVGRVSEAGSNYAKVVLVTDSSSSVSALSAAASDVPSDRALAGLPSPGVELYVPKYMSRVKTLALVKFLECMFS